MPEEKPKIGGRWCLGPELRPQNKHFVATSLMLTGVEIAFTEVRIATPVENTLRHTNNFSVKFMIACNRHAFWRGGGWYSPEFPSRTIVSKHGKYIQYLPIGSQNLHVK